MKFTFKLSNGPKLQEYEVLEDVGFKPIYYYLDVYANEWNECNIHCDDKLIFVVRNYGKRTYISRYNGDKEILTCTLLNKQLSGFVFLHKNGILNYILKYDHNNLEGEQVALKEAYRVRAKAGQILEDVRTTETAKNEILFAHEMTIALVKWC